MEKNLDKIVTRLENLNAYFLFLVDQHKKIKKISFCYCQILRLEITSIGARVSLKPINAKKYTRNN